MGRVKGKVRAGVARGIRGLVVKERKMEFNENDLYATKLVNDSDDAWPVYEKGKRVTVVPPHKESLIESWRPDTDFARYEKIVRAKDGHLICYENPAWQSPWQGFLLDLINDAGAPEETIYVVMPNPAVYGASDTITVQRGIPKSVPLNVQDPLIKYRAIRWQRVERRVPVPGTKYFNRVMELVKELVPRSEHDLKNVLKERQEIERERLAEESRKAMAEQEKLLLGEQRIEQAK